MPTHPVRAVVVSSVLCLALASSSVAAAHPRQEGGGGSHRKTIVTSRNDDVALREVASVARFVKQLIKKVLVVGNADTISTPKP